MNKIHIFLFFVTIIVEVSNAVISQDKEVLVLNDGNFDEAVSKYDLLLVEFYAPWCGHCKALQPEWTNAATAMKSNPMKFAKVDATESTKTAAKYNITGIPAIKLFYKGEPSEYDGGRVEEEIIAWVKLKTHIGPGANFYDILGVKKWSNEEEIKIGYKAMAMKYHPDKNPNDIFANYRMAEINKAYEILSDETSRDQYDRELREREEQARESDFFKHEFDEDKREQQRKIIITLIILVAVYYLMTAIVPKFKARYDAYQLQLKALKKVQSSTNVSNLPTGDELLEEEILLQRLLQSKKSDKSQSLRTPNFLLRVKPSVDGLEQQLEKSQIQSHEPLTGPQKVAMDTTSTSKQTDKYVLKTRPSSILLPTPISVREHNSDNTSDIANINNTTSSDHGNKDTDKKPSTIGRPSRPIFLPPMDNTPPSRHSNISSDIISAQNREYEECVARDMVALEQLHKQRSLREKQRMLRVDLAESVGVEPSATEEGVVSIAFKFKLDDAAADSGSSSIAGSGGAGGNGSKLIRRFRRTDQVKKVLDYVETHESVPINFRAEVARSYPFQVLTRDMESMTLQEAELGSNCVLTITVKNLV